MSFKTSLVACALLGAFALPSHAALLPADGQWHEFAVDELTSTDFGLQWIDVDTRGTLSFSFTVAAGTQAHLTVLDAGFAGDTFRVFNGAALLGNTSLPGASYPDAVNDFDQALADSRFSRGVFNLEAGSYVISGLLDQSLSLPELGALNSTSGAVKLDVSPVPLPAAMWIFLSGFGALTAAARRRRQG